MKKQKPKPPTTKPVRPPKPVAVAQIAKAWLMAQPDFQRMMLALAENFAERVVAEFSVKPDDVIEHDGTFGEWLGPSGSNLWYWNHCNDDILGNPLLHAVRALELDVLLHGRELLFDIDEVKA